VNHNAIRRVYTNAVIINDSTGAFDADGNQITIDQALVDAAAAEIQVEAQWNELRLTRNRLIAETDYLALSDSTLSAEMATYRQALRDLPANTTDPTNPDWPVKPGGAS
jgi:hypothetical protein